MRITFVFPFINLTGGIRVHLDYANELFAAGHDVTVVYPSWPYRFQYTWHEQFQELWRNLRREISVQWYSLHAKLIRVPLIRTHWLPRSDVVIAVGWPTLHDVVRLPTSRGKKVHIVMHHESGTGPEKEIRKIYRMPFYRIAYAQSIAGQMRNEFNCEVHDVVPNGVNTRVFYQESVHRDDRRVLMLYHPDPRKGANDGLKALNELRCIIPNVEVHLIGPVMPPRPLPFGVRFTFYPSDAELRYLYNTSTALVYPSLVEGFGLPPLEAMACGCPVVTTDVGAIPEFAQDGVNAFVIKTGDTQSMANRLSPLLRNAALRDRFSTEGLRTARQYSLSAVAPLFESALRKAAS
ncbi:glycosyltransferase family 4 protein [bacterium]|nr:glycosyltransferase family 4 protein [bacterium]MCI0611772.1 glycosyltransferase family 4 protein [bacterium]